MKLAEHYGDKPPNELPMLFQRILSNCTLDWFRRQKTRRALFSNMSDFESRRRRRRFRSAGNLCVAGRLAAGPRAPKTPPAGPRSCARSKIEIAGIAGPSTRSVSDALLGGDGRRRNGRGHGLLRRQRQNPLFPRRPCPEQGAEGQGNHTMNTSHPTASAAAEDQFGRRVAAAPGGRHRRTAARHRRAPARRPRRRRWPAARCAAAAPRRSCCRRGGSRRRSGGGLVDPHRLGRCRCWRWWPAWWSSTSSRTTAAPASWPRSMPRC